MLSIELFDSKYEQKLHEGAVDQLEQHRIDTLNDRMQELLSRAKESRYKNDPAALDSLKQQYQKIKDERDSYFKVRESKPGTDVVDVKQKMKALTPAKPGVAGAVKDVAQGLKNFLQGRPETGPTYESQKKSPEKINEYLSMSSDKNYQEAEPYKNYKIYVRRKPFGNTGIYTAHTEIDRKEFMGKGSSQEEAVQAIRDRIDFVLNAQKKVTGSSTIDFNVKFATDLLADPRQTFYAKLENINGEPKLVIAGADVSSDPELLAAGDFKRSSLRNQVDDEGRATPLPGIPLTAKGLRSGEWIANGRYTIGQETQDRDGNRVFDLTYHSTAHTKSDKLRLNQPAFTLGTAREVDEDNDSTSTDAAERAILNRIMVAHTDLLQQYGPQKVMQAVEEVAYNVGDVEEIGSSDVSGWVRQVQQILGATQELDEKWSAKYKRSINCNNPRGFSQRAHCQGRKK